MAVRDRIEWRPGRRSRPLRWLVWYLIAAVLVLAIVWVLFAAEPDTLESGKTNQLADAPTWCAVACLLGLIPFVMGVVRRPTVSADHYALAVRPGMVRTLVLPWAHLAEIAMYEVRNEPYLLIRCAGSHDSLGDWPRFFDRGVLRAAFRANRFSRGGGRVIHAYDLAVRMSDFTGEIHDMLGGLAEFAPEHVIVANELV